MQYDDGSGDGQNGGYPHGQHNEQGYGYQPASTQSGENAESYVEPGSAHAAPDMRETVNQEYQTGQGPINNACGFLETGNHNSYVEHGSTYNAANAPEPPLPERQAMPAERSGAQIPEPVYQTWRPFAARYREANGGVDVPHYTEDWREPSYSQTYETTSEMYTPGIHVNQHHQRRRGTESKPENTRNEHSGLFGRLIRAVCLILVCAAISGAASYAVLEFRIRRGDFDSTVTNVTNQVTLGNTGNPQVSGLTSPIVANGTELPAEVIYEMALSQVVGIESESPTSGVIPGIQSSTTPVTGSGFIISGDGYILTNYHVIEAAYNNDLPIRVYMHDGSEYAAQVIGFDEGSDVALIKIEAEGLNAVVIGDSDEIRVGQSIYAVGNPFGDLFHTMTAGIISALDRVVSVDNKLISAFQFDAAVNPGNSGGPIFNRYGDVIGIVSMKIMGNAVEGIGFAIPINDAIEIAMELIEHGYITGRPYIGITVSSVTRGNADFYGLVVGASVRSVAEGSAGEKAGLAVGDIIIALGDTEISSRDMLLLTLRRFKAGDTTTLTVWRDGEELKLTITFDENLNAGQPQRP